MGKAKVSKKEKKDTEAVSEENNMQKHVDGDANGVKDGSNKKTKKQKETSSVGVAATPAKKIKTVEQQPEVSAEKSADKGRAEKSKTPKKDKKRPAEVTEKETDTPTENSEKKSKKKQKVEAPTASTSTKETPSSDTIPPKSETKTSEKDEEGAGGANKPKPYSRKELAQLAKLKPKDVRKRKAEAEIEFEKAVEERRKQKKLKREERKPEKAVSDQEEKKPVKQDAVVTKEEKDANKAALDYLQMWKSDRQQWKFQKVRQTYLLKHMYDPYKVPKTEFKILLDYLDGVKGQARTATCTEAEKMVEDLTEAETKDEVTDKGADAVADRTVRQIKLYRAKKISQLLV